MSSPSPLSLTASEPYRSVAMKEIFQHLLRTLLLIAASLAAISASVGIATWIGVRNPYVYMAILVFWAWAIIYGTARWHPYWAPVSKRASRIPWTRDDSVKMETLIEYAIVQAGMSAHQYLRVSIRECETGKLFRRRVIGDEVTLLGKFGNGIWCYIHDKFYARRDGLVCLDLRSCEWTYHEPQSQVELPDDAHPRKGILQIERDGVLTEVDLNTLCDVTSTMAE